MLKKAHMIRHGLKAGRPPRMAGLLLAPLLNPFTESSLTGDLEEEYRCLCEEKGIRRADLWYWRQVLKSMPWLLNIRVYWSFQMLKNYFKIAFRNITRNKGYSFINIVGLAVGIAGCLLISLWVKDELSYDRFHENADLLYRVEFEQNYSGRMYHVNVSSHPLGPALKAELPEIEEMTRFTYPEEVMIHFEDKTFYEEGFVCVDSAFFSMFSFPFRRGEAETALKETAVMVITEDLAHKYFGNRDPVGRVLTVNGRHDFTVSGVVKNPPSNSTIRFSMAVPYDFQRVLGRSLDQWNNNSVFTFVRLGDNVSSRGMGEKIEAVVNKHSENSEQIYSIRSLTDIHLQSHSGFGKAGRQNQYVYIFSVIAMFVLLIACTNFMNLATARSARRAREVGLRKVVGAFKNQIIRQFFCESGLLTFLALILALGMVWILLPVFNQVSGKEVSLAALGQGSIPFLIAGVTVFTGLLAGSYPALFLSAFQPIETLRGSLTRGLRGKLFRRVLVVLQFSLSIGLIIGTGVVSSQLGYIQGKDLGFDKDHLIYIQMRAGLDKSYAGFKDGLLRSPDIMAVSAAGERPSAIYSNFSGADWEGKPDDSSVSFSFCAVDYDYTAATGIEIASGRGFSRELASDADRGYVVNETAVAVMGMDDPIGKRFSASENHGTIIGVVKDFHFLSLRKKVDPLVLFLSSENLRYVLIRVNGSNIPQALAHIKNTWGRVMPQAPFEYRFINQDFDAEYRAEQRMGSMLRIFSLLAVFVACLGLFGLASHAAEQRTREIGIRKVLGADMGRIGLLLTREFLFLVLAANLFAWPVSYLAMRWWLQDFAYRTPIRPELFLISSGAALAIALLTVVFQAVKAGLTDPVQALKHE